MHILAAVRNSFLANPLLAPPSGALTGGLWHGRVGYDAAGRPLTLPYAHVRMLANPVQGGADSLRRYIATPRLRITIYSYDDDEANTIAETVRDEFDRARLSLGAGTGEAVMGLHLTTDVMVDIEPEKLGAYDVWSAYVEFLGHVQRQRKP